MTDPVYDGYFADPFALRLGDGEYVAYGTVEEPSGERVFEALRSSDLVRWQSVGPVLERVDEALGGEYWAPEVVRAEDTYWMYYSVGRGIVGHHIRVAVSTNAFGPFTDLGANLTPDEQFAIDPHPFQDVDGRWFLFFARDVLEGSRVGTQLAVAPMTSMTTLGTTTTVLEPNADWQIYERGRTMYGRTVDWHTLEGPSVVHRLGKYWLTYSGGAWNGPSYAVSWAVGDAPLGPWRDSGERLLSSTSDNVGPGHNSLVVTPSGSDAIVFHSWDAARTARRMHVRGISFEPEGPRVDGPIRGSSTGVRSGRG